MTPRSRPGCTRSRSASIQDLVAAGGAGRNGARGVPEASGGDGPDDLGRLVAEEADALTLLERREANAALYRILDRVGEKYRVVIVLFELEGLSGEQIAALTGICLLANVWIRLQFARDKDAEAVLGLGGEGTVMTKTNGRRGAAAHVCATPWR